MIRAIMIMKNKILKICFLAVVGLFFSLPVSANVPNLVVQFENTPLFNEANFLPGSSITRWVKVYNNTDLAKNIIAEAIYVTDPDDFGDVLDISIKEGGTELFSGSLSDFFDGGEIVLSSLAGSANTQYDFSISFNESADNDYQGKTLGFDILIGFEGEDGGQTDNGDGGGDDIGGGSTGGGGAGGYFFPGMSIRDESVYVTDIQTTSAVISWYTSYRSTSRVIYDTSPNLFDFSITPNYGYAYSTAEFDTPPYDFGVNQHTVTVTGLNPMTTYYFRVISHASPPTISREYVFLTKESGLVTTGGNSSGDSFGTTGSVISGGAITGGGIAGNISGGSGAGSTGGDSGEQGEESGTGEGVENGGYPTEEQILDEEKFLDNLSAATILGFKPAYFLFFILFLILIIIFIIWLARKKRRNLL